jgi:hypothetical protein
MLDLTESNAVIAVEGTMQNMSEMHSATSVVKLAILDQSA